jgi:hypothetical protein
MRGDCINIEVARYKHCIGEMWCYAKDRELAITKKLLKYVICMVGCNNVPKITSEAIEYLNELYEQFINQLIAIETEKDFDIYIDHIQLVDPEFIVTGKNLHDKKISALEKYLYYIVWDSDQNEPGLPYSCRVINPWTIKEYIMTHKITRDLFHLSEDSPTTFPITIIDGIINLKYEILLGVMVIYRHLHKMHPFSYKNHRFKTEMKIVDNRACSSTMNTYRINIYDDTYSFDDFDFIRGMMIGASLHDMNPDTCIKNLRKRQDAT